MTTHSSFQFHRLALFLQRQIRLQSSFFLLGFGGLFSVLLLVSLSVAFLNPEGMADLVPFYLFSLFLCGLIVTDRAFVELNNPQRSYHFFTLPVSNLEKLVGLWLLSSPIFVVLHMAIVDIVFQLSLLKTGNMRLVGALLNADTFHVLGNYLVLQTVFFLGACTFKTHSFFRTLLSLLVFVATVVLCSVAVLWAFFQGNFEVNVDIPWRWTIAGAVFKGFYFLLAPFFLLVSYYKLKERQA